MGDNSSMAKIPSRHLAGLVIMIERIGGECAAGRGKVIVEQTGEKDPTYDDVASLADDPRTFDVALSKAGADLPAGRIVKLRLALQLFGPDTPVCEQCGDLGIDIVGKAALVRSAGQACPGCGKFLVASGAESPYPAWTTGRTVPSVIEADFDTVPGDTIYLSEKSVRRHYAVDAGLDALLGAEGVLAREFLLWLVHGPEKRRFVVDSRLALDVLENPLPAAREQNVLRNWVGAAKAFKYAPAEPASASAAPVTQKPPMVFKSTHGQGQLIQLFQELFSAREIQMFIHEISPSLVGSLPDISVGTSTYAFEAGVTLERNGVVNRVFFPRLLSHRPDRRADIEVVANTYGFTI